MASDNGIVLFHYGGSIYSQRILWYLALRGIPYAESIQPSYMPRPDLAQLGISYRRIPILAVGRDVYCDSRLILRRLEQLDGYGAKLDARTPAELGVQRALEAFSCDSGLFWETVKLIPFWTVPMFQDPKFIKDREELTGGKKLVEEELVGARPAALSQVRYAFELFETTFLADGREWVLGGNAPTLADIDAIFPLQWVVGIDGSLPEKHVSEKLYPKTFAWIKRFWAAIDEAKGKAPKPVRLDGPQTIDAIVKGNLSAKGKTVDDTDPLELKLGDTVEVYINDLTSSHRDSGKLLGLTVNEVVIENAKGLHLHFPRWGFTVTKSG